MEQAINRPSLDVSGLPNVGFGTKSITWWGIMGMMVIEGTVFALMIAAYFYLSTRSSEWPPHSDPPDLFWGTLNTLVFVISLLPNEWYRRRAHKGDLPAMRIGLVVLTLFGLLNIIIRYFELKHMNTDWSIDAYGSAVWTLMGLHVTHLLTDWVDTVVLTILFFRPSLIEGKRFMDASENAGYWNFVVLTWIPIYLVIYWCAALATPVKGGEDMRAEQRVLQSQEKPASARRDDFALWASILVPLHAAGVNTIVGFMVAHHACNVNKKGALLTVPIIDLVLALGGGALAWALRARFMRADDVQPLDGRRLFMANLGVLIAALCTLIIIGGLLATIIVSPCD